MSSFQIHIYTDGACSGNPGPGGYGIVMEWVGKNYTKEFSQGFIKTTNNRMELLAVIEALKKINKPNMRIKVITDSRYVSDSINKKWLFGWVKKSFKGIKNPDLWIQFHKEFHKHQVTLEWIKGHNNHKQNERCDFLAVKASKKEQLQHDVGYEQIQEKLL